MADLLSWKEFNGLNNKGSSQEIYFTGEDKFLRKPNLTVATNVDFTKNRKIVRRPGRTLALAGSFHSAYSCGDYLLAVRNNDLVVIEANFSYTTIKTSMGGTPVSYVSVNDIHYLTNQTLIGYVKDRTFYSFLSPTDDDKRPTPSGRFVEYYNGRLLVAVGRVLWFTDVFRFNQVDRLSGFKQLPSEIVMVAAVDTGVYVSDTDCVYFLSGKTIAKTSLEKATSFPAIPGTVIKIHGKDIKDEYQGSAILFTGKEGICLGLNGGQIINLTRDSYRIPSRSIGTAMFKNNENIKQYITALRN